VSDLEKLKEQLREEIASCISGYVGFITHPQRERLTKDVTKRVVDKINERIEVETYSQQMQSELEPIDNEEQAPHIGGMALDWTFHSTDDDCEFDYE
jgi:hypothetical protein